VVADQVPVVSDTPRLIWKGFGPAPLHEEGSVYFKRTECFAQPILRTNEVVRTIWMLGIEREGDAQFSHRSIFASRAERTPDGCQLRISDRSLVRMRVPVAAHAGKLRKCAQRRLDLGPGHPKIG